MRHHPALDKNDKISDNGQWLVSTGRGFTAIGGL